MLLGYCITYDLLETCTVDQGHWVMNMLNGYVSDNNYARLYTRSYQRRAKTHFNSRLDIKF